MLLVLALAMNACDDYYSVTVNGDPGITPTVLITPEESITLPAKEAAGEIEIISNMDNSTISFHVPSDAERWCSVTLEGNRISLALEDNPRMIARSTILTIKVFSVTRKIEVVQDCLLYTSCLVLFPSIFSLPQADEKTVRNRHKIQ